MENLIIIFLGNTNFDLPSLEELLKHKVTKEAKKMIASSGRV